MPKFLDAPSWYDGNGNLKTIQGDLTIYVGSGYNITFDVPHVGGTNIDRFGGLGTVSSEYYLLPAASAPGRIPYYVNTNIGYQTLPSGTSGQVLTSNGTGAAPSWRSTSLFLHNFYLNSDSGSAKEDYKRIYFTVVCSKEEPITSAPSLCSFMTSMRLTTYPATGIYTNKNVIQVLFSYTSSSNWRISVISGEWMGNLFMSNSLPDGEIQDNVIAISLISN